MFYDSTERRKEIFDDTMRLCRDNKRLAESVKSSINRTIIYPANNDPFIKDGRKGNNSEITVTMERSWIWIGYFSGVDR